MAQIKLKVGDLVRLYRPDPAVYTSRNSQEIGVVTEVDEDIAKYYGWVKVKINGVEHLSRLNCLAHVKFNKWMPWNGGECPIGDGTPTQVRFRDGYSSATLAYPESLRWTHEANHGDIVGFRIMKDWE